jgi:hypothetical protein
MGSHVKRAVATIQNAHRTYLRYPHQDLTPQLSTTNHAPNSFTKPSSHYLDLEMSQAVAYPAPESSDFLRLPGEIRNYIYAYVLTTPDETLHFPPPEDSSQSANQLQYVCKELHRECHWLELKFNPTLKFKSAAGVQPTATQDLLSFLHAVPTHRRTAIKVVELCSGAAASPDEYEKLTMRATLEDTKHTMFHLADVCRYNAHITFKYMPRPAS